MQYLFIKLEKLVQDRMNPDLFFIHSKSFCVRARNTFFAGIVLNHHNLRLKMFEWLLFNEKYFFSPDERRADQISKYCLQFFPKISWKQSLLLGRATIEF